VAISFILINLMVSSIHRDWFKSKLYIRLTIVTVVPVVLLFIIAYISRFILTYNVFNIIMVVIIMSNTKSKLFANDII
jgi:ABC-type iron transport system FetAB permease component